MIAAIIQARMTSTRLPGKVMMDLGGKTVLQFGLERVQKSKKIDKIIVATPDMGESQPIVDLCNQMGITVCRGDELDVLSRYAKAAKESKVDIVVRICSDCPFIDPDVVDQTIQYFLDNNLDHASNLEQRSYPDGLDCEVFTAESLYEANEKATHPKNREHVSPYIDGRIKGVEEKGDFKCGSINNDVNYGHLMWSVNTQEQLDHIRDLYNLLDNKDNFNWHDLLKCETLLNEQNK